MVFLRPILESDRELVLDILTSNEVSKTYMTPEYEKREDALQLFWHLMEMSEESDIPYVRAIASEDGFVGFLNMTEINEHGIELGYVIHPVFQRKGYMTQALKLAMEELFSMGYREVSAGAFSSNTASIRVMEKCGMTKLDKTEEIQYRGNTHTCVFYSVESPTPMTFSCCFCGKNVEPHDSYILFLRRTNDVNGREQELRCHRKCMEKKLKNPKLLYLNHM